MDRGGGMVVFGRLLRVLSHLQTRESKPLGENHVDKATDNHEAASRKRQAD